MLVKKELSGIPLLPVPACDDKHARIICPVQIVELPRSGRIMVVDYYKSEDPHALYARFFSDANGWLTVREWPAQHWSKQQPISWARSWSFGADSAWSPDSDAQLAMSFLPTGPYLFTRMASHNAALVVESFINLRRSEQSAIQSDNRKNLQKYHFSLYPNLPEDLPDFMNERVFTGSYIFISASKKGVRTARCSHCGTAYEVPSTVKHRQKATCPCCGRYAEYVGDWFKYLNLVDVDTVAINHKVGTDLIIRWVSVTRTMSAPDFAPRFKYQDIGYNLHLHEQGRQKLYCYLNLPSGEQEPNWVRRPIGTPVAIPAHIYTRNLTQVFGKKHYNVDLADAFSGPSVPVQWHSILVCMRSLPTAEYLLNLRMPAMVGRVRNPDEKTPMRPAALLDIDPNMVPLCRAVNVTPHELYILRDYGRTVSQQDFEIFRRMGHIDKFVARKVLKQMSFTKFVNYFSNQPGRRSINTLMREWLDYCDMATAINVDLNRKSNRYPKDIHAAHNGILTAFYMHKQTKENAEFESACSSLYAKMPFIEFVSGNFMVRLPMSRTELSAEGKSLHHCVGLDQYFRKHIAGTHLIVFIRKTSAPDVPYVTMELRMQDFTIAQIHGFGDRDASPAERAFAERYVYALKTAMSVGMEVSA